MPRNSEACKGALKKINNGRTATLLLEKLKRGKKKRIDLKFKNKIPA